MVSTPVNRTLQSSYSDYMGMYPPVKDGGAERLTKKQQDQLKSHKINLPFNVRNAKQINEKLGKHALPHDFVGVPVYNYNDESLTDDTSSFGCHFIRNSTATRLNVNELYTDFEPIRDKIKVPIAKTFGKTVKEVEKAGWHEFFRLVDTDITRDFENSFNVRKYFTDDEWKAANLIPRDFLTRLFAPEAI